jgi:hypothetical protein
MVHDVFGDGIQTVVPLDDLNLLRKLVFQFCLLGIVQILVLANFGEFLSEIVVLNENLWNTFFVEQRYRRASEESLAGFDRLERDILPRIRGL